MCHGGQLPAKREVVAAVPEAQAEEARRGQLCPRWCRIRRAVLDVGYEAAPAGDNGELVDVEEGKPRAKPTVDSKSRFGEHAAQIYGREVPVMADVPVEGRARAARYGDDHPAARCEQALCVAQQPHRVGDMLQHLRAHRISGGRLLGAERYRLHQVKLGEADLSPVRGRGRTTALDAGQAVLDAPHRHIRVCLPQVNGELALPAADVQHRRAGGWSAEQAQYQLTAVDVGRAALGRLPVGIPVMIPVARVKSFGSIAADRAVRGAHRRYPAVTASLWNIRTVSSEKASRSRPSSASFFSRSCVTVMMWTPRLSACRTLRISRGLAQSSSSSGYGAIVSSAAFIIGTGSRPVSATRPANTEMTAWQPPASVTVTASTWLSVMSAVTFTWTPEPLSSRTTAAVLFPRVSVTGIFT